MKNGKLFRVRDIVSIFIFIVSLLVTIYVIDMLLHEDLGIGQTFLSFILLISVFLTLFFAIGLLRHFTGFVKKSWIFYIFQFLSAVIVAFIVVPIFSTQVITHSQEEMSATVKNELTPIIRYIEKYQQKYGKLPQSIGEAPIKPETLKNVYYDHTPHTFILGTYIASLDIDGAQIFYNSRDKQWYQFHNDMYQYYKDKKEKPKGIEHYMSFHNQADGIASIIRKTHGVWVDPKQEAIQSSQGHLTRYKKSCEASDGPSCTAVGMRYGMGLEVEQSNSLALKYFTKACELDDANGCHYLGDIYAQGKGVQKDVAKAIWLYKKACDLGNKRACKKIEK